MNASLRATPTSARRIIGVCVDDFGQHEGINRAALELAARRRVSAVSCLVDGPAWGAGARALRAQAVPAEVGLHLNFTEDFGQGGCFSLRALIARAYLGLLDRTRVRASIERQLDHFVQAMGRLPDFVDGHQHVHQLPVIRDVLVAVMNQRYGAARPWLRATQPPAACAVAGLPRAAAAKSWLIGRLGARPLRLLAARHGYPQNNRLLGVYGFEPCEADYLRNVGRWFDCAHDGDVLMCHPSLPWAGEDPLQAARTQEYRTLAGEQFAAALEAARIEIRPLRPWVDPGGRRTVLAWRKR